MQDSTNPYSAASIALHWLRRMASLVPQRKESVCAPAATA
jgi:hypothetical protein